MKEKKKTMDDLTPQLKQILESARRVELSNAEKNAIRARVEKFAVAHPRSRMIPSPWAAGRLLVIMHRPVAAALIAVLVLGGGTVYAAEGSLPGDALYAIKVDVVEEAVAAATISDEGRARWDARRAERRLEEAIVLRAENRMTNEAQTEIETRFEHLADAVESRAQRIKEKRGRAAAITVLAEFEGTLRKHDTRLAKADMKAAAATQDNAAGSATQAAETTALMAQPETATLRMMEAETEFAAPADMLIATETPKTDEDDHDEDATEDQEDVIFQRVRTRIDKLERALIEVEQSDANPDSQSKRENGKRFGKLRLNTAAALGTDYEDSGSKKNEERD